ncbi:hypothetical protein AB0F59_28360 [Micromonospora lupini]|uniref:hypothetical protein n=1 Tax=Micromonospora lupini TaxID=285679 RepID=UPI0034116CC5
MASHSAEGFRTVVLGLAGDVTVAAGGVFPAARRKGWPVVLLGRAGGVTVVTGQVFPAAAARRGPGVAAACRV